MIKWTDRFTTHWSLLAQIKNYHSSYIYIYYSICQYIIIPYLIDEYFQCLSAQSSYPAITGFPLDIFKYWDPIIYIIYSQIEKLKNIYLYVSIFLFDCPINKEYLNQLLIYSYSYSIWKMVTVWLEKTKLMVFYQSRT